MTPLQPLVDEDLADAAAFDRYVLLLVEVDAQAIQRPAAEGQAQNLWVSQCRGEGLGAWLGRVGARTPGAGPILQAAEALLVKAVDPGVDRGAGQFQVLGDLARPSPARDSQEDLGSLDEACLRGPRVSQLFESVSFLGGQFAERNLGEGHGCTSLRSKATPVLRPTPGVSSPTGCTTKRSARIYFAGAGIEPDGSSARLAGNGRPPSR